MPRSLLHSPFMITLGPSSCRHCGIAQPTLKPMQTCPPRLTPKAPYPCSSDPRYRLPDTKSTTATRTSAASGRLTPPVGNRASTADPASSSRGSASSSPPPPGHAFTPMRDGGPADSPSNAGSNGGSGGGSDGGSGRTSPPPFGSGATSRRVPLSTPRPTRSAGSSSTPAGGGVSGSRIPRGVTSQSRGRRDTTAAAAAGSPDNGRRCSKSPVPRGQVGRSKSPVTRRPGGRSKSPVPTKGGRRVSRSPVPRSKKSG